MYIVTLIRIQSINSKAMALVGEDADHNEPFKLWANGKIQDVEKLLGTSSTFDWSTLELRKTTSSGSIIALAKHAVSGRFHVVTLLPLEIKVVKKGETTAPDNGLIVKKNDVLEFSCSSGDQASFPIKEENIHWYYCARQMHGQFTPWTAFGSDAKGVKFEHAMTSAGVYRVKVVFGGMGSNNEFELLRKRDEKKGNLVYGFGKAGQYDCFGVSEDSDMVSLVKEAQSFLASTYYASNNLVPAQYGWPAYGLEGNAIIRCNIFVAHRASAVGVVVPHINGLTLAYPPIANQWAGIEDCDWVTPTFEDTIAGWTLFKDQETEWIRPGMVVAHPQPGDAGHCAIIDYDGEGIGAGVSGTVNKKYDEFFDETSGFREYAQ